MTIVLFVDATEVERMKRVFEHRGIVGHISSQCRRFGHCSIEPIVIHRTVSMSGTSSQQPRDGECDPRSFLKHRPSAQLFLLPHITRLAARPTGSVAWPTWDGLVP
jgi:hypothetical protein